MARPNEIDPRVLNQLAGMRASRRRFLGRGAATAAAIALGPAFLAACSDDDSSTSTDGTVAQDSGTLRISNWPLYMVDGFIDRSSRRARLLGRLPGGLQRQRGVVREGARAAVAPAGHRHRPRRAHHLHGHPPHQPRLAQRDQRRQRAQQEQSASRSARVAHRSGPAVHHALHVRHGRPRLQPRPGRTGDHQHRRPLGSRRSPGRCRCSPTSRTASA